MTPCRWIHEELPAELSALADSGKPVKLTSAQLVELVGVLSQAAERRHLCPPYTRPGSTLAMCC